MHSIKEKTSRKLMIEFRRLQKQFWGRRLWARGCFVASSVNVTDEAKRKDRFLVLAVAPTGGNNWQIAA